LISVVGQDSSGAQLLEQTAAAGVDVSAVLRSPDYATGSYLAILNAAGELQFALDDMRAMSALSAAYLRQQEALFDDAALVFVDANLPRETLRAVMKLARTPGRRLLVCADPTSKALAPRLQPYLRQLHLVTPNSAEAALLCETTLENDRPRAALEIARALVSRGVEIAVITLPRFGVCYATSETSGHIPAIRTQVVDPTGAGDALTAALLFALLNDISLDDAVRLGVAAAALTMCYSGAVLPDLTLEKLYDQLAL
jgi:pseudouridine kinase